MFRIDLRRLILWVGIAAVLVALLNTLYASFLVQRDVLINSTLENNRVYALKLADLTENFVAGARRQLALSADKLGAANNSPPAIADATRRLQAEANAFSSVVVADVNGEILGSAPDYLNMTGSRLDTTRARTAQSGRAPTISQPFLSSITNRWQITFTQPIFSPERHYLGFIAGNLYLHEKNAMQNLLGVHFYRDGSYLYVVDRNGLLIYHPQGERIGEKVIGNAAVDEVVKGRNGQMRLINTRGVDVLAGYASVPSTGWGIVAQQASDRVLQQMEDLLARTVRNTLPILLLSLLAIWWLARNIARPLQDLAGIAKQMDDPEASNQIREVKAWYFEAAQLKRALLAGLWAVNHKMHNLRQESTTDPLTGLMNRRGLAQAIDDMRARRQPVAVIAIDIDHFKAINDALGHDAGDIVIRSLASLMGRNSRSQDVLARPGGEEFLMLLPDTGLEEASKVAERLRLAMSNAAHPSGFAVTIALGLAHFPGSDANLDKVLKLADGALYQAKNRGRNRSCMADEQDPTGYRTVNPAAKT